MRESDRLLAVGGRAAAAAEDAAADAAPPPPQDYRTPRENDDALCASTVEGGEWRSRTGFVRMSLIGDQLRQCRVKELLNC